jgi:hypothetical protein
MAQCVQDKRFHIWPRLCDNRDQLTYPVLGSMMEAQGLQFLNTERRNERLEVGSFGKLATTVSRE